ncbi:MAG TPA: hypothetical protein VKE22_19955 [Haliangiales bacterium]|nr:hypothetical protein [Haliangiales bacterium]
MVASLARALAYALVLAFAATPAVAKRAPERFYFELRSVDAVDNAPATVSAKAKQIFADIVAKHADFEPDPAQAKRQHLRAYAIAAKITTFERSLAPNDKPGRGGQVLTITVEASLIGTSIPGNILSLSVSGGATIKAETGNRVLPREEEAALDDALAGAFKSALDDAATKLRTKSKKK